MGNHISQFTNLTHIAMGISQTRGCALHILLYRSVWSSILQCFYFKPMLSGGKHKCSVSRWYYYSTFKVVHSCSAVSNFGNIQTVVCQATLAMGILQTKIMGWVAMPYPGTARLKIFVLLFVFVCYVLFVSKYHKAIKLLF